MTRKLAVVLLLLTPTTAESQVDQYFGPACNSITDVWNLMHTNIFHPGELFDAIDSLIEQRQCVLEYVLPTQLGVLIAKHYGHCLWERPENSIGADFFFSICPEIVAEQVSNIRGP